MQNQITSELNADDKKATLIIFLRQLKTFMKNFIQKKQRPKLPLLNF